MGEPVPIDVVARLKMNMILNPMMYYKNFTFSRSTKKIEIKYKHTKLKTKNDMYLEEEEGSGREIAIYNIIYLF